MQNTRLDESQAGIKIAGRNINNFRYVDDMTLTVDSEEELKNLLMKVKETSEKAGLYLWRIHVDIWQNQYNIVKLKIKIKKIKKKKKTLNIQKTDIMASGPTTSRQTDGEKLETVTDYFLGLQNNCRWWLQPWN